MHKENFQNFVGHDQKYETPNGVSYFFKCPQCCGHLKKLLKKLFC